MKSWPRSASLLRALLLDLYSVFDEFFSTSALYPPAAPGGWTGPGHPTAAAGRLPSQSQSHASEPPSHPAVPWSATRSAAPWPPCHAQMQHLTGKRENLGCFCREWENMRVKWAVAECMSFLTLKKKKKERKEKERSTGTQAAQTRRPGHQLALCQALALCRAWMMEENMSYPLFACGPISMATCRTIFCHKGDLCPMTDLPVKITYTVTPFCEVLSKFPKSVVQHGIFFLTWKQNCNLQHFLSVLLNNFSFHLECLDVSDVNILLCWQMLPPTWWIYFSVVSDDSLAL